MVVDHLFPVSPVSFIALSQSYSLHVPLAHILPPCLWSPSLIAINYYLPLLQILQNLPKGSKAMVSTEQWVIPKIYSHIATLQLKVIRMRLADKLPMARTRPMSATDPRRLADKLPMARTRPMSATDPRRLADKLPMARTRPMSATDPRRLRSTIMEAEPKPVAELAAEHVSRFGSGHYKLWDGR